MSEQAKNRSRFRGVLLNGLIAIAFVPLNLLLMGIPSMLVVVATLPLATVLGNAATLNSQLLNVTLYLTFLWPPSFMVAYWVGFGFFRGRSKLIKWLIYGSILYAWANVVTFVLSHYFAQSSQ
jgi:hypothetical protein